MRIVQVIDSLETGGAERMAVNYANSLAGRVAFSGLISTRAEGSLKSQIDPSVQYFFLKKKHALDPGAVVRMARWCRRNRIDIIHAHSTSYFIAILVKMLVPRIRIVWHDHNGNSEFLEVREAVPLNVCSFFFVGIIVVNNQLKHWAERELHCDHVMYIPNFTLEDADVKDETLLQGEDGKRILQLANLREQKNHQMMIEVAKIVRESHPEWTFHMVGKDFNDDYSRNVKDQVKRNQLSENVFFYGSCNDTTSIIRRCDIAILTSKSEGLPVALLEYGLQKKPVVVTKVGEVPLIVQHQQNGFLVPKNDVAEFAAHLVRLIEDGQARRELGDAFHQTIIEGFSEAAAIGSYLNWAKNIANV